MQSIDRLLAETAPDLARRWRRLAKTPRYLLLLEPDERFACVLILLQAKAATSGATPEERLLWSIFSNFTCVLAIERSSRILYDLGGDDLEGLAQLLGAARRGEAEVRRLWPHWASRHGRKQCRGTLALLAQGAFFSLLAGSHYRRAEKLLQQALNQHPALQGPLRGQIPRIHAALKAREMASIRQARDALCQHLDPRALRHARGLSLDQYHWLNIEDASRRRRREQALAAYPLLVSRLVDDPDTAVDELTQIIDAGRELVPALAARFGVSKAIIRRLRTARSTSFTNLTGTRLRLALRLLAQLPPAWWPNTAATWRIFRQAVAEIWPFLGMLRWHGASEAALTQACQGFVTGLARPGWERGWQCWRAGFHWTQDLGDARDLWAALRQSYGLDDQDEPEHEEVKRRLAPLAEQIALGGIAHLRDLNEAWHAALHQYDNEGLQAGPEGRLEWPAIAPSFAWQGWVVEAIGDTDRLAQAASVLRNCAAGYTSRCLFSPTHLLTIGRGERIHSLAEVRVEKEGDRAGGQWRLDLLQHRGRFNKEPHTDCRRALDAWQRAIAGGDLGVDFLGLEAACAEQCAQREQLDQHLDSAIAARDRYALRQVGLIDIP